MLRVPIPDASNVSFVISTRNIQEKINEYFESVILKITDACDINNLIIQDPSILQDSICWNCKTSSDSFRKLIEAWNHYDKSKDHSFYVHNISFIM